jgi:hypothetical protein
MKENEYFGVAVTFNLYLGGARFSYQKGQRSA